jgi:hypothetical protein
MFKRLLLGITALSVSAMLLLPGTASAGLFDAAKEEACKGAALDSSAKADCGEDAATETESLIATIVNLLTVIVGIAAVIMIIVNGLRFITAGGDSNSVNSARNGVIYALIGLVIVALAQVIVRFVLSRTG